MGGVADHRAARRGRSRSRSQRPRGRARRGREYVRAAAARLRQLQGGQRAGDVSGSVQLLLDGVAVCTGSTCTL